MNTDRLLTAGIALCCIFAIGTSASTLGSSVNTNPDEVVNVDYRSLPINPDDAGELKRKAQSKGEPKSSHAQSHGSNSESKRQKQQSSASDRQKQSKQSDSMERPELLDRLLELLRRLLRALVWLVPVVAVAGGVALGVRFRDRLFGPETDDATVESPTPPPTPDPSNDIERTWWTMVEQFGVERPHTKTPGECAREAVEAGADEDAIETLTRTFEEVRYGGAPVTDDQRDRIRPHAERLGVRP